MELHQINFAKNFYYLNDRRMKVKPKLTAVKQVILAMRKGKCVIKKRATAKKGKKRP